MSIEAKDVLTTIETLGLKDEITAIAKKVGADSYYHAFDGDHFETFGVTARYADAHFSKDVEGGDADQDEIDLFDYYSENCQKEFKEKLEDIAEKIAENLGSDNVDAVIEIIEEDYREAVFYAMSDSDKSTPRDLFSRNGDLEAAFIRGTMDLGIDDLHTEYVGYSSGVYTIVPNHKLMHLFALANVSIAEFAGEIFGKAPAEVTKADFSDFRDEVRPHWQALLDLERGEAPDLSFLGDANWAKSQWAATAEVFGQIRDWSKPSPMSAKDLVEVIENASYGGVATYVIRPNIHDVLDGKYDTAFVALGGQIGLHDFLNGSGHLVSAGAPVVVDRSKYGVRVAQSERGSVDNIYSMISRAYQVKVAPWTGDLDWFEVKRDTWHRIGEAGKVVITKRDNGRGSDEYHIASLDLDGREATSEVYQSLVEAKNEGDRIVAAGFEVKSLAL